MKLICDTGPLLALANRKDAYHEQCVSFLDSYDGTVILPSLIITEVCYLIQTRVGAMAEAAFLDAVAFGEFTIEHPTNDDWKRIAQLTRQYSSLPLGVADAAVVATAERLDVSTVATVDKKHFRIVRPSHCGAFDLVPA